LKPPQTIASKYLNGVPPLQIKFSAAPSEDQSDHLFLCHSRNQQRMKIKRADHGNASPTKKKKEYTIK